MTSSTVYHKFLEVFACAHVNDGFLEGDRERMLNYFMNLQGSPLLKVKELKEKGNNLFRQNYYDRIAFYYDEACKLLSLTLGDIRGFVEAQMDLVEALAVEPKNKYVLRELDVVKGYLLIKDNGKRVLEVTPAISEDKIYQSDLNIKDSESVNMEVTYAQSDCAMDEDVIDDNVVVPNVCSKTTSVCNNSSCPSSQILQKSSSVVDHKSRLPSFVQIDNVTPICSQARSYSNKPPSFLFSAHPKRYKREKEATLRMFFSGDPSTRKRVDLGGRSSKERDRQKLLEQTRLERNRRLFHRLQNSSATKIQKCFRAWRAVQIEHQKVREQFFSTYGRRCENVDRHCFSPTSKYLRELLFFFSPKNEKDLFALLETCRLLLQYTQDTGDAVTLFAGMDYFSNRGLVNYRVKQLTYACTRAVHAYRNQVKTLPYWSQSSSHLSKVLLEAVIKLIDPNLPWSCEIVQYILKRDTFTLLREITLAVEGSGYRHCAPGPWALGPGLDMIPCYFHESVKTQNMIDVSSLEHVLMLIIPHDGKRPCVCQNADQWWSFVSQILTIPFLWHIFPRLKETLARQQLCEHYVHQMSLHIQCHDNVLPKDVSNEYPSYACLLGNLLEAAAGGLSDVDSSFEMAVDLTTVATSLLEMLPPLKSSNKEFKENSTMEDEEMIPVEQLNGSIICEALESQIANAINSRFLLQLTNALFGGIASFNATEDSPNEREVIAIGAACAFLHVIFNTLPLERMMTILAYRTTLVPVLWNFMKRSHETQNWAMLAERSSYLPEGAPGWLLPLAVFCPIYKHMLMIVDNEEFYEQEKPLALKDIRGLIVILRQALWQLLWVNPVSPSNMTKFSSESSAYKKQPLEFLQYRVSVVTAELLTQLQDWNNRRQFASPTDFHADGVNEAFISQAMLENTRAREIIKQAPFLLPFTSRVKIFASQLAIARKRDNSHGVFTRNRLKIRRDHILEDAFDQLSTLSEEDLKGSIRVTFINELGVEEAGIDGGGIFKDFMENITRAAFDIQYGLFKETADHLLYPNPGSGLVHEQHLQYFHFLGTILAKAMFEGILVDIPFATFFLSKLKQKHNYLNDLPSLDPELYRHLLFLKHYQGDVSGLELYFVIVNNEYGEQTEEELIPGGKNIRVTSENVIPFIHLIANHRLNFQIRQQSSHFLRGFQQLILKEWIDMFNEHELQILISGSLDGLDIDNLRSHTQYSGGYHAVGEAQSHSDLELANTVLLGSRFEATNHELVRPSQNWFRSRLGSLGVADQIGRPELFRRRKIRTHILVSRRTTNRWDWRIGGKTKDGEEHYVIEMFWEVLKSLSQENQRRFLKFVTGCSRGPLLGFKSLEPQFCIQRAAGSASEEALERLPTSATCMNLLKLPPYRRFGWNKLAQLDVNDLHIIEWYTGIHRFKQTPS
ncbi:hypothetical protein KSS87_001747 [Heliosperma pusillum]|nr:hypothetical protein KSS87_001747 [Heliosperma pusillum]